MVKVLVIDDDAIVRSSLSRILSELGCHVAEAEDGVQGEKVAADWKPNLILLDIMMPVQDGYETCTNIRARGYKGQIVTMSSLGQEFAVTKSLKCGANNHCLKPLAIEVLQGCINKCAA